LWKRILVDQIWIEPAKLLPDGPYDAALMLEQQV
jgi:hypothetical protein